MRDFEDTCPLKYVRVGPRPLHHQPTYRAARIAAALVLGLMALACISFGALALVGG